MGRWAWVIPLAVLVGVGWYRYQNADLTPKVVPITNALTAPLDTTCTADSDCQLTYENPCLITECACPTKAASAKTHPQCEKSHVAIIPPPAGKICPVCEPRQAVCEAGQCVAKSKPKN